MVRRRLLAIASAVMVAMPNMVNSTKDAPIAPIQQEVIEVSAVRYLDNRHCHVLPEYATESAISAVNNPVDDVEISIVPLEQVEVVKDYTEEQLEILAIIIYQEAGGDSYSDDTRRKVGEVFLNRVESSRFPNSFEEVATQYRQYGTLCWTGIKWPDRASNEGEAHAVKRAYNIAEELLVEGVNMPSTVIWQAEFPQGDGIYSYQDNLYFCYSEVSE